MVFFFFFFFFSSRRRHTRSDRDWSSDVCSSDLADAVDIGECYLDPLVAGQVHSRKPGHARAVLLRLAEVLRAASMPCPDMAPASVRGSQPDMAACGTRLSLSVSLAAACASGRCR